MKRISRFFVAVILLALAGPPAWAAERPPNLVIILTDDQGYADVGFNGCKDIPTPHLDSIAERGVRFTNGYVTFPVCGPSRAGLITGRYQGRFGFGRNPIIDPRDPRAGLPLTERTLADMLGKTGYTSMAIGKWHLGCHTSLHPLERGFDAFYGFLSGGHNYFPEQLTLNDLSEVKERWAWYRTKLLRDRERVEVHEYLTDALSNEAVAFVDRCAASPFFLYLAYNAPHTPLQATEKYLTRVQHIPDGKRRTYAAMLCAVDDGVGRVLEALRRNKVEEHTLVFFLSDNGGPVGNLPSANGSDNRPLRGGKGNVFEGGVRVPFAAQWPGILPGGVDYHNPVSSLDIFATMAARVRAPVDPARPLDGVDLVPYLTGERSGAPHETLYWRMYDRGALAMRHGALKRIRPGGRAEDLLFDLDEDLGEQHNLAPSREETGAELDRRLRAWERDLRPPAFRDLGEWKKPQG